MNSFLDSNVLLNYIFSYDEYHDESKDIISKSINYYSSNVKKEVDNSFIRKNKEYKSFILRVDAFINKFSDQDLVNENEVNRFIAGLKPIGKIKVKEMQKAFINIWDELDFNITHDAFEVKLKFNELKREFQFLHQFRKDSLFEIMILVPNHTKKDKRILDLIEKENLRDELLHFEDENILFDANEFAKNNEDLDLGFVTTDQGFFKAISILMGLLSFDNCINLMEFSSNT